MDSLGRIAEIVGESSGFVVLLLCAVVTVLLIATIYLLARVRKLSRARALDLSAEGVERLARVLGGCTEDIKNLQENISALSSKLDQVSKVMEKMDRFFSGVSSYGIVEGDQTDRGRRLVFSLNTFMDLPSMKITPSPTSIFPLKRP